MTTEDREVLRELAGITGPISGFRLLATARGFGYAVAIVNVPRGGGLGVEIVPHSTTPEEGYGLTHRDQVLIDKFTAPSPLHVDMCFFSRLIKGARAARMNVMIRTDLPPME